jgi:hypothetical protein
VAVFRLHASGGSTFEASWGRRPIELSRGAQERLRELAEAEQDGLWQLRFGSAAVACHAATLVGWLVKTADSPEVAERRTETFHGTYGLIAERYLASFLRAIGYLTRLLLDEKRSAEAQRGVEALRQRKDVWLSAAERPVAGNQAAGASAAAPVDRSIVVGLISGLGYLGDWEPILTQLGPGEPWLHEAARNVFAYWVPGPLAEDREAEPQQAAEWITHRLARPDLPHEVRSTLQQIKADLEQKLGHHIWPDEDRDS